jgi:hypothetical protein
MLGTCPWGGQHEGKTRKRILVTSSLYATDGHSGTFYMRLAASRMQMLHALAASCVQSRQFFDRMLREQLIELKNEDDIKKSENLRDTCAC